MEYDSEYIEKLQKQAAKMAHALELSSMILNKRGTVSLEITKLDVNVALDSYYRLMHDCDND